MKTILVILMLLIMVSAFADWKADLKEEGIDERLILHYAGGFALSSFNHIWLSNWEFIGLELTQESVEDIGFYLTTTGIVIEELYSNNWEGVKFWKLTSAVLGMASARMLWKGSDPVIYPKYYGQKNEIGLEFAFQF